MCNLGVNFNGVQEAAGSNPAGPTLKNLGNLRPNSFKINHLHLLH